MYRSSLNPRAHDGGRAQSRVLHGVLCQLSLNLRNLSRALSLDETIARVGAEGRQLSRQATAMRRRVLDALLRLEHHAPTLEEQGEYEFARRLFNALLDGWADPYVTACYYTFGLHPAKLLPALAARRALQQWELYRHDPSPIRDGGPQESSRHMREVLPPPCPLVEIPLPALPREAAQAHENKTPSRPCVKLTLLPPTGTKD